MIRATLMTFAASALVVGIAAAEPRLPVAGSRLPSRGPGIRIWTSSGDLYRRNERVRVYYRTERDAYVTILRVDTDGRVRVLFPRHPDDEGYAVAGAQYSVSGYDRGTAFVVDDYAGVGYLFAVASAEPFDYRSIYEGDRWNMRSVSDGRIHGDPRASLEELMVQLLPEDYADYDTHLTPYYVERRYDYPRFVCYDCHSYVPYSSWNPYHSWCRSYTLVVWNDPWYYYPSYWYPTRYYGGRRVVYTYANSPSRYVFKARDGNAGGVDYRRRDVANYVRRPEDRGVRATDIGGVGAVPAPRGGPDRRVAPDQPRGGGEEPRQPRVIDGGRRTAGSSEAGPTETRGRDDGRQQPSAEPRRRDGSSPAQPGSTPGSVSPEPRRRAGEPGIEIVPGTTPVDRERTGREPEVYRDRDQPRADQPRTEPRRTESPRVDLPRSEQPRADQPRAERPRPEARPEPAARPERTEPSARPERAQPKPESARPAPEQRPRPEASRPSSPPPQSRPEPRAAPSQPAPREQPSGGGGLVRRRP